jgi:hypothetical protein
MQAVEGFDLQFSPAFNVTTPHYLFSHTTILQPVSKPKNCELKQEFCAQATALHQPLKFHNCEKMSFFTFSELGRYCSEIVVPGLNFCFNSKPSFSFDSIGQKINILLPRHFVTTTEGSV